MTCSTSVCDAGSRRIGTVILVLVLALLAFQVFFKSAAPTPPVLDGASTLNEAVDASATDGKVVFVVAHADWCRPCQSLKRGALSDPTVAQWLESNAHPVSLDVTKMDGSTPQWVKEAAETLKISGIPAMVVMRDGRVISKQVGSMSADDLLAWLKETNAQPSKPSTPS